MTTLIQSTTAPHPSVFQEFERNNNKQIKAFTSKPKPKPDILLDSPLRYLAYTNEIGAAVKPLTDKSSGLIKQIPLLSYAPVAGYIIADAIDKYKRGEDGTGRKPSIKAAAREVGFQAIASVVAPTAVVTGVQKLVKKAADKLPEKIPDSRLRVIQFAASAGTLLAAGKIIDKTTEKAFEKFVDPLIGIKHDSGKKVKTKKRA